MGMSTAEEDLSILCSIYSQSVQRSWLPGNLSPSQSWKTIAKALMLSWESLLPWIHSFSMQNLLFSFPLSSSFEYKEYCYCEVSWKRVAPRELTSRVSISVKTNHCTGQSSLFWKIIVRRWIPDIDPLCITHNASRSMFGNICQVRQNK